MMKPKKNERHIACEALENRRMFVTYQVDGTNAADSISISISGSSIISAVNGVSDSASDIINNNIEINGLGGNDTISIVESGNNTITVNAGSGNDTINIAAGGHDLRDIENDVTINGDGNSDVVNLLDANDSAANYAFESGNQFTRVAGADPIELNVETVTLEELTPAGGLYVNGALNFDLSATGNGSGKTMVVNSTLANESVLYVPSAVASNAGVVTLGAHTIGHSTIGAPTFGGFSLVTFRTANADDSLSVSSTNGFSSVTGNSGGVSVHGGFDSCGTVLLDTATNDAGAGNDSFTLQNSFLGGDLLAINSGTGNNTLTNHGTYLIDTNQGAASGTNLSVETDTPGLTFSGFQNLKKLQIDNGATVQFTGSGSVLSTQQLTVLSGGGSIDLASGQSATCASGGSFSLGATATLTKKGAGTLNISSAQSHTAGATFINSAGTTNFNTDCGSAASRTLQVNGTGGATNLNTTQHIAGVFAGPGMVNVGTNGSRVLVTNFVDVNNEGGALNLNDNDMIVDYTNASDATNVRALLHAGRSNGSWAGIGINSVSAAAASPKNKALGSMEATDFKILYGAAATFDGQAIDNTSILIKYTYYGDANFNGKVDGGDYSRIDSTFNKEHTAGNIGGWINGDFDDNGKVDGTDYALIDSAFNSQSGVLRPATVTRVAPVRGF